MRGTGREVAVLAATLRPSFNRGPVRPRRSRCTAVNEKVVLAHDDLARTLRRIAHEIAEKNPELGALAVVGIHTRGALLARRLHTLLGELTGAQLPIGDLDIS